VLVRDGRVIGRGWHHRAGGPHAEVEALADAARRTSHQSIEGATCYVSLEPCAHHGKTPPCADALIAARIGRVVIASHDPNPRVAGTGIERMRAAGITVDAVERDAAFELNKGFVLRFTQQRPWVRVKVAASLDGRSNAGASGVAVASGDGDSVPSGAGVGTAKAWFAVSIGFSGCSLKATGLITNW
jgi:diaminohydroxyphosphoribosylaminopyrimidine deaminase/5-amino-6-(5-phosphoribosylamino)uracil reductase